jgi:hypothetical protein
MHAGPSFLLAHIVVVRFNDPNSDRKDDWPGIVQSPTGLAAV